MGHGGLTYAPHALYMIGEMLLAQKTKVVIGNQHQRANRVQYDYISYDATSVLLSLESCTWFWNVMKTFWKQIHPDPCLNSSSVGFV